MERKKVLPLLLSSAMAFLWACAEGDIVDVTNADEIARKKIEETNDSVFVEPFLKYCEGQKDCKSERIKSSSSKNGEDKSSSSKNGTSSDSKSSSSSKVESSSSGVSSSSGGSSSSKTSSSSKKLSSSSKEPQGIGGKCDLIKPNVVRVGDTIVWRYQPNEGTLESANFVWNDVSDEVRKGLVDGALSGVGLPEIAVKFTEKGFKSGPVLNFGNHEFDCDNLTVFNVGEDPGSSSSVEASSSSKVRSSSSAKSSSSSIPEGHCAVSKSKVYVGEEVDWYIADENGNVLEGFHKWTYLGDGNTYVRGEQNGNGSTRITVTYSTVGTKETMVQFAKQGTIACDTDMEGEALLEVLAKAVSSSSEEPQESSSSNAVSSSSKSPDKPPVVID